MNRVLFFSLALLLCFCVFPAWAEDDNEAPEGSGLPVPRFVALKSKETNVRAGPGERYPVLWVYHRPHWPVEIIEEFDHWRKIRDMEGTEGWVHRTLVEGKRSAIVRGGTRVMRRSPDEHGIPLLRIEPGVSGRLLECTHEWCRLQIQNRKGWLRKSDIWGVYPKEEGEF